MRVFIVFIVVFILSSCGNHLVENQKIPLSLEDSVKTVYGIEGDIEVLEFDNYPDSIEFAAFLRLGLTQEIIDSSIFRNEITDDEFEYYRYMKKEIVCKSPNEFPTSLNEFKDWYFPVGLFRGKVTYSNYCEFMFLWEINDSAIVQPGMDGSLIYPLRSVEGTLDYYKFHAFDPLNEENVIFELYKTEYHHTYILHENVNGSSKYTLVSKYSDLKFHQFLDYRCDGIEGDYFLNYPNIDSIKVETDNGLKYFGEVRPCKVITQQRDQLELPFTNSSKVSIFSFDDKSLMGKKQRKNEIFSMNILQRNNIKDSIDLTFEQIKQLNSLFYSVEIECPKGFDNEYEIDFFSEPDCVYYPHHLIAIYDLQGNIRDYLEVCFMCDMWNTSTPRLHVDICELQHFMKVLGVKYGLFPYPCDE